RMGLSFSQQASVLPIWPVSGSPVLDEINPSRLEVLLEQVPERNARERAHVGRIVDDDVDPAGSIVVRHAGQEFRVLLASGENANAMCRVLERDGKMIDSHDLAVRKVVSPE